MPRLTSKFFGKTVLPIIPMNIATRHDLDEYHKQRKFYEECAIRLSEYEDAEEQAAAQQPPAPARWANGPDEYPACTICEYRPPYDPHIDDIFYSPFCPNCGTKMEEAK